MANFRLSLTWLHTWFGVEQHEHEEAQHTGLDAKPSGVPGEVGFMGVSRAQAVRQARMSKAWAEQCRVIALLGATAVLLNAFTTGDHLGRTLSAGYWPVAGVLSTAIGMGWLALAMDVLVWMMLLAVHDVPASGQGPWSHCIAGLESVSSRSCEPDSS